MRSCQNVPTAWILDAVSWNKVMGSSRAVGDKPCGVEVVDDRSFVAFYGREFDGQVRRAALLLGSATAANDVVHDAFVAVYQRWGSIVEPGPYLNRAVLNACRDRGRRASRRMRALDQLRPDGGEPEHEILWDVLRRLPFNQRAAVVLRFYGGLTEREIADSLDSAVGSVGPWITRALATMRKEL